MKNVRMVTIVIKEDDGENNDNTNKNNDNDDNENDDYNDNNNQDNNTNNKRYKNMHSSKMFITPSTTFRSFSFFPPLPPRLTPPSLVSRNTNKNKFQKLCKSSTTAERSGEIAQSRLR